MKSIILMAVVTMFCLALIAVINDANADCGGFDCVNYDLRTMTYEEYNAARYRDNMETEQRSEMDSMRRNLIQDDFEDTLDKQYDNRGYQW